MFTKRLLAFHTYLRLGLKASVVVVVVVVVVVMAVVELLLVYILQSLIGLFFAAFFHSEIFSTGFMLSTSTKMLQKTTTTTKKNAINKINIVWTGYESWIFSNINFKKESHPSPIFRFVKYISFVVVVVVVVVGGLFSILGVTPFQSYSPNRKAQSVNQSASQSVNEIIFDENNIYYI